MNGVIRPILLSLDIRPYQSWEWISGSLVKRFNNIILSFKDNVLFCPPFCCNLQKAFETMTPLSEWCLRFARLSATPHCISIKYLTCTTFGVVQADPDHGWPLSLRLSIHYCCRFHSAACADWFCSCWQSRSSRRKRNSGCDFRQVAGQHFVLKFDEAILPAAGREAQFAGILVTQSSVPNFTPIGATVRV